LALEETTRTAPYVPPAHSSLCAVRLVCYHFWSQVGTFYEGVMTRGYSSNATDAAVQANIVAAGYGK
jgi:hypothetical protein